MLKRPKRAAPFGFHGTATPSCTKAKLRAGMRVSLWNTHSAASFQGCASVPGATGAPGGSGASRPVLICTPTGSVAGSDAFRNLSLNASQSIGGGFGRTFGPKGTVTVVTARSTVTVPCSGGPSRCSVAPTDTLIEIVTQPIKQTSTRSRAPTATPTSATK